MGRSKKGKFKKLEQIAKSQPPNFSAPARNLRKTDLAGVIFGCKNNTIGECYSKQLFGLPSSHMAYVKNITPGLALFLFNYSDRTLHGIFEASSYGRPNIDPYGWTDEGTPYTPYPAQVRVNIRRQCHNLTEEQFKPIIAGNYYEQRLFWFELTQAQTKKLIELFSSSPVNLSPSFSLDTVKWDPPSHSINNQGTKCADDVVDNWESLADIGNLDQSLIMQWSELDEMSNSKFVEEAAENLQLKCQRSYSSVVGGNTSSPLPEKKWSSLFKSPPASEGQSSLNEKSTLPPSDQCNMDRVSNNSWEGYADEFANWESDNPESSACTKVEDSVPHITVSDQDSDSASEGQLSNGDTDERYNDEANDVDTEENDEKVEIYSSVIKLVQQIGELKASQLKQIIRITSLEKELVESKKEIQEMKQRFNALESGPFIGANHAEVEYEEEVHRRDLDVEDSVLIVGGFNGSSWLLDTDAYSPSLDQIRSLRPMTSLRKYASAAKSHGEIFVFGGVFGKICYDTVESYNPATDQWVTRKSLNQPRGCLAGASLNENIYAIGGGNGTKFFSEVEMFDPNIGNWVFTQPMQQARIAPAAAEMNGVLYAVGGCYRGIYLNSVERYDPRENLWTGVGSMSSCRGCHSLAVLNEKLYAVGGYDGSQMLPTVEVFDPRTGSWMAGDSMNSSRGYSAAFTVADKIYVIGGMKDDDHTEFVDTIECYREGRAWEVTGLNGISRRCHFSALLI